MEDFEFDNLTGRSVARGQMQWIIYRGESVETQKPRVYEYERFFEDEEGFVTFSEPIYRSSLKNPPIRLAENEVKEENSTRRHEPADFRKHVIIEMTTPVPVEQLRRRGGSEHPHRILAYRVEVNVSGTSLVIKATSGGKTIGETIISGLSEADE
ncbi:hypothetical protein F5B17DRAFT_436717 [Nemania serpens]|nr:hypothetical protein F5B17DRAFT_436717 [Nemania serpens]